MMRHSERERGTGGEMEEIGVREGKEERERGKREKIKERGEREDQRERREQGEGESKRIKMGEGTER